MDLIAALTAAREQARPAHMCKICTWLQSRSTDEQEALLRACKDTSLPYTVIESALLASGLSVSYHTVRRHAQAVS